MYYIGIRLNPALRRGLEAEARRRGMAVSPLARFALADWLTRTRRERRMLAALERLRIRRSVAAALSAADQTAAAPVQPAAVEAAPVQPGPVAVALAS